MISKIMSLAKKQLALTMGIVLAATVLSGCAGQKLGKQTVVVKHYPQCYRPIGDLREAAKKVNQATAAGAIFGAITGAAIAYSQSGGNKAEIAKGAIAGGLSGAGLGYLISSEVQAMDQAERFRTYIQAMDMDVGNLKQAVAAAKMANNCYDKEYKLLAKNAKAGRVPQPELAERVKEIQDGSNDAMTILKNYSDGSEQAASTYDQVIAMERDRPDKASNTLIRSVTQKKTQHAAQIKDAAKTHDLLARNVERYQSLRDINTY
ncbi:MAG: hypothetical protein LBE01_06415 [Deltaproteobacteria bacterium]|jgi:hypothetical protein|nr:hypothetical protein [Deltaproteobacteria bacterium]